MQYICNYVLKRWKKKGLAINKDGTIDVLSTTGPAVFSAALKSYIHEPQDMATHKILEQYNIDKTYRKRLNQLGIFFTRKGFFNGIGTKNLFWGSWAKEAKQLTEGILCAARFFTY